MSVALENWDPNPHWYTPLILYSVIYISKFIMQILNRVEIHNQEAFQKLANRNGRGLLTYSNHNCLFDDPFLLSLTAPVSIVRQRHIAADAQNFFSTKISGIIFSQGQCIPIVRGAGMNQPGFDYLKKVLREGGWVHIFPEGTRNRNPENGIQSGFTQGIAHLILDSKPIVLPFYHQYMEKVLPVGGRFPRIGKKVRLVFGESLDLEANQLKSLFGAKVFDSENFRDSISQITDWTYKTLKALEDKTRNEFPN